MLNCEEVQRTETIILIILRLDEHMEQILQFLAPLNVLPDHIIIR